MKIVFDFDGVLSDFQKYAIKEAKRIYEEDLKAGRETFNPEGIIPNDYDLRKVYPRYMAELIFTRENPIYWKPRSYAASITCNLIQHGHEVYVMTARQRFCDEVIAFIVQNFPWIPRENIIFCVNKSLIMDNFDYIIEDNPHFPKTMKDKKKVILLDMSYNKFVDCMRIKSLCELHDIFIRKTCRLRRR